jgi:hypothetical protein
MSVIGSNGEAWLHRHAGLIVALLAALTSLPFIDTVWLLADEGIWLHAAQRMLRGQVLYRDFFEFHPPVGFLLIAGWQELFGPSLVSARALMVLVTAITAWFTFACCRLASGRVRLSASLTLLWVIAGQGMWTQVNHHWFTTMFSMIALWGALSAERRGGTAIAGIAASLAALVTTHRGGLVVVSIFAGLVLDRQARRLPVYIVSGLACAAVVLGYLLAESTAVAAFEQVVLYTMQHYSGIQAVPFGAFASLQFLPALALYPLVAVLLAASLWQDWRQVLAQRQVATLCLFAIAGLVGSLPRPDAVHIAFAAALALPLLAALLAMALPAGRSPLIVAVMAILAFVMTALPWMRAVQAARAAPQVASAAGMIKVLPRNGTGPLIAHLSAMPSAQKVFFYPYDPVLPFLTGKTHPARIDILVPEYSTPEQYRDTCAEIMRSADWVVVDHKISAPSFYRAVFPAMRNPSPPEKRAFEKAIFEGFSVERGMGDFLLLRRENPVAGACNAISG